MKGEWLFRIVGLLDDDLIGEAEDDFPRRKPRRTIWLRFSALAATLLVVAGAWWLIGNRPAEIAPPVDDGAEIAAGGGNFSSYNGPILPLSALENNSAIEVSRALDLDFTGMEDESTRFANPDALVEDTYTLTNPTDSDLTITAAYPSLGNIADSGQYLPMLFLDGQPVDASMAASGYIGGFTGTQAPGEPLDNSLNLDTDRTWEKYRPLLEDGALLDTALRGRTLDDHKVTVYRFSDISYPEEFDAAYLSMEFSLPPESVVLTYGLNGFSRDEETGVCRYGFFASHAANPRIIIVGEPPASYKVQGYEDGGEEVKISIDATVTQEESTLSAVLRQAVSDTLAEPMRELDIAPAIDEEFCYQALLSMLDYTALGDDPKDRYEWIILSELVDEALAVERVFYLTASVTVPAGGSIELRAGYRKRLSFNYFTGEDDTDLYSCDWAATAGSRLKLGTQQVSVTLPNNWSIAEQNVGITLENRRGHAEPDPGLEHCFINITSAPQRAQSARESHPLAGSPSEQETASISVADASSMIAADSPALQADESGPLPDHEAEEVGAPPPG